MGFHVDYESLNQKYSMMDNNFRSWNASLENISNSVKQLINSSHMSGEGANSVKLYLDSIHNTIIPYINGILIEHMANWSAYKSDYNNNIDSGLESVIDESELETIKRRLKPQEISGNDIDLQVQSTISAVSDLINVSCPGYDVVEEYHNKIDKHITSLVEDINALEDNHVSNDFILTSQWISDITAFINDRLLDSRDFKSSFTVEALRGNESTINLLKSAIVMSEELKAKEDAFSDAVKTQEEYFKALNEEIERREKAARNAKIGLTIVVVLGTAAVTALTAGLGAAVVVGAASGAISAGGSATIDQYVKYGNNTSKWDYGEIGKSALFGGIAGGITGTIGYGSTEVFKGIGESYFSSALTSSSLPVRIGSNAVMGSTKSIVSGVAGRFTSTLVVETFKTGSVEEAFVAASEKSLNAQSILVDAGTGAVAGGLQGTKKPVSVKKQYDDADIIDDGPYIRDGKPYGRPELSGEAKLEFEQKVYDACVGEDGVLRDPHTNEVINWKPGEPRADVVDFGHKTGLEYDDVFQEYAHGKITLEELKKFQYDADNFVLEAPSANRSHSFEADRKTLPSLSKTEKFFSETMKKGVKEGIKIVSESDQDTKYSVDINLDRKRFGEPRLLGGTV